MKDLGIVFMAVGLSALVGYAFGVQYGLWGVPLAAFLGWNMSGLVRRAFEP